MDIAATIDDTLDKFSAVAHGLDAVEALAKWALADDKRDSFETLHTIAVIIDTLRGTFDGKISAIDTREEIASLRHALMGPDRQFDQGED